MSEYPTTRAEARAAGSMRYYPQRPCLHGHLSPRYTISGTCVECQVMYRKKILREFYARREELQRA